MAGVNLDDVAVGGTVIVTAGRVLQNVTFSGVLAFSGTSTTGASSGDFVFANARGIRSVTTGGTGISLLQLNTGNQAQLNLNNERLNLANANTATTVGAAGGASALPATPVGYLNVQISGVQRKIPYYND